MTEGEQPRLSAGGEHLVVTVPLQIRRRGGRKQVAAPAGVAWASPIRARGVGLNHRERAHSAAAIPLIVARYSHFRLTWWCGSCVSLVSRRVTRS
jgi:hypothetical protein